MSYKFFEESSTFEGGEQIQSGTTDIRTKN